MTIKRGGMAEPISGNIYTKEIPAYCPHCAILHFQSKLGPRVYTSDQLVAGSQLPYDHDQWLQCYHCGLLVPRHDIPKEGSLTTDVERINTKFRTVRETEQDVPKPKHQRGFNERLSKEKEDDGIKDPELKRELKKGAKLLAYHSTGD